MAGGDVQLSTDPRFEAKLVDVVGLYLNPPQRAAVFCFDEKTRAQALDRTQPSLPMRPGRAGTMTHDYKRHGTTDIFAALNVATGEVQYDCRKTHTGKDVLALLPSDRPARPLRPWGVSASGVRSTAPNSSPWSEPEPNSPTEPSPKG